MSLFFSLCYHSYHRQTLWNVFCVEPMTYETLVIVSSTIVRMNTFCSKILRGFKLLNFAFYRIKQPSIPIY